MFLVITYNSGQTEVMEHIRRIRFDAVGFFIAFNNNQPEIELNYSIVRNLTVSEE